MFDPLFSLGAYTFSLYSLFLSFTAVAALALAIHVVRRERGSRMGWWFAGPTGLLTVWLLARVMAGASVTEQLGEAWARAGYLAFPFLPVAFLQFAYEAVGSGRRPRWLTRFCALAAAVFSIVAFTTSHVIAGVLTHPWGFYPRYGRFGWTFILFFSVVGVLSLTVLLRAVRRLPESRQRHRLKHFAIAYAAGFAGTIDFAAAYGAPIVPLGAVAALAVVVLVGRAIRRYQLFDITPAFAAKNIVSTMSDALIVTDDEGWIRIVNDAACELSGYLRAELLGAPIGQLFPVMEPGDRELRRREGPPIPVSIAVSALREGERRAGTVVIAHDLRERLRIEQELRQQALRLYTEEMRRQAELEYRDTFDAIQMPLILLDANGIVQRANRAALALANGEEVIGRAVNDLSSDELWPEIGRRVATADGSQRVQFEDSAGTSWDVAVDVIGAEGERRIIVAARNISAIVQLQRSLRRSETMSALGTLLGGVAHEVRNPLFAMSSTLDAFTSTYGAREEYRQFAQVMHTQLDRVSNLMSDLLEFGRPAPAALTPQSIRPLVEEAISQCADEAAAAAVKIVCHHAGQPDVINVSDHRLLQAFSNLVRNAVQYSPPGGTVAVRVDRVARNGADIIVYSVTDQGPGFNVTELKQVFEPFFTRRKGGTGLGLAIARAVVEQHHGTIAAANLPEGGGIVSIELPVAG
ncbi:MAG TPA: ATP-binding protein [Thermoanaerobaculia bacterium]